MLGWADFGRGGWGRDFDEGVSERSQELLFQLQPDGVDSVAYPFTLSHGDGADV